MAPYLLGVLLLCGTLCSLAAEAGRVVKVPATGLAIRDADRAELQRGVEALEREIQALRAHPQAALLPDVEIFHKAVDWALRYDEFYRSNEVGLARSLLKQGLERARQLRSGQMDWLSATGLVVRGYRSRLDDSVQPYGLVVPAGYAPGSPALRLDVWLHGRDDKLTELKFLSVRQRSWGEFTPAGAFVLHPYGRYCNAFKFAGEVDVFEAMEHVRRHNAIDERRVAVRGFSMGGAGTWHLAAHYPGVWAAAAPGAGFAETAEYTGALAGNPPPAWEQKLWQLYDATDYAANFLNLPVVAYNGTDDKQRQAADVMERALRREGLDLPRVWGTNVGHKYTPEAKRELGAWVDGVVERGRVDWPDLAHFTTRSLRYAQGPGVEVLGLEEHWRRADVVATKSAAGSVVSTTNVTAFRLIRASESELRRLIVDGKILQPPVERLTNGFRATVARNRLGRWEGVRPGDWPRATGFKSPGLQGPIDDAFLDRFLIVRPTATARHPAVEAWVSERLAQATNEWRAQFRGDARIKDDVEVTEQDIQTSHLILFGDPQSNRLLGRLAKKLPIDWTPRAVRVGRQTFPAETHAPALIVPNPLNPARYVVVNSGFTFAGAGAGSNARQTPKLPDYAVFAVDKKGAIVLADFFDERWRLR